MKSKLTTKNLTDATAASLAWLGDHGFKYFKSYNHFRRKNNNGYSYVHINSVTHNRIAYHLTFYLGVQITDVETCILELMGDTRKIDHYDRTIWNYTVNIGPSSPHWSYPIQGRWTLGSLDEFDSLMVEVNAFVRDLGVPFVTEHQDTVSIRRTLMESPGHAANIRPYRPILAIGYLNGSATQLEADIAILDKRYERYAARPRKEYDDFVARVRIKMNVEKLASIVPSTRDETSASKL